ncbi:MAG: rhodanese-like domain-containing protein [Oscillospiraceae bacterium]|nr:rhodanese-like domain-containing protein [Oscillospiraceae bacterium]
MKRLLCVLLIAVVFLTACDPDKKMPVEETEETEKVLAEYKKITADEAKELIDSNGSVVILDVRELFEYEQSHLIDAILIPVDELSERVETELLDKNEIILVYCRSGGRSARAAQLIADMGYTNVYDFGGILDWKYETAKVE